VRSPRRGFTIVEIVLAMGIMVILTSLVFQTFRGQRKRTEEVVCKESLNRIRNAIDHWQLEWKRPWFKPLPPAGAPEDPWTQPFRVDPRRGMIWSLGPDGKFESPDQAEDLAIAYTPFTIGPVGRPRNVRGRPALGGGFLIMWDWPEAQGTAIGFRILRSASPGGSFSEVGTTAPDQPAEFRDMVAPAGKTMYYRVEALLGPGSTLPHGAAPSKPYALTIPQSSLPGLELEAGSTEVLAGVPLLVKVTGKPRGAALAGLVFDGEAHPVGPGAFTKALPFVPPGSGVHELEVRLEAVNGQFSQETLTVTVP
jgi:type II secretory pathway pseudopilin PulG